MKFLQEQGRIFALDGSGKLLAEVTYPTTNGIADIEHTFVDDSLRGQGVAAQILEAAVQDIRAAGLKAKLTCPYAVKWFAQHPEHADLLWNAAP